MKMSSLLQTSKRLNAIIISVLFCAVQFAVPLTLVSKAFADSNNGTLQVHNLGSAVDTKSNEPKVCVFDFELFDVDPGQTGTISVDTQGNGNTSTHEFDVTISTDSNGNGDAPSTYINQPGGLQLADGHYKATLDNKFGTDQGDKAKSKVFKVECDTQTATAPTMTDLQCGVDGNYTIPEQAGVAYSVDGVVTAAGTYTVATATSHTITAASTDGDTKLTGTTSWTFTFTDPGDCTTHVTSTVPTMVDLTCNADGSYTIPEQTGVHYTVNGTTTTAGTYTVSTAGTYTIQAVANSGYTLDGTTSWTFTFTTPQNCVTTVPTQEPTATQPTCEVLTGSYTLPEVTGISYTVNGVATAAGTHTGITAGTYNVVATAQTGYVLTGTTSWTITLSAAEDCEQEPTTVTPTAPTFKQPSCEVLTGSYTIPEVTGVTYKVNGVTATAGTHTVLPGVTVHITAEADSGYVLADGATASWNETFTAATGCVLGDTDVCPNLAGSQATVPSGYSKNAAGNCVTDLTGQVLGASTVAATTTTQPQLANTGESSWLNTVVGISALVLTIALGLVSRKTLNI